MIIKHKTSKTPRYKQLLDYLTKDANKTQNALGEALIIKQGLFSNDYTGMVKEFYKNEENRIHHRTNNIKLNHEIISFSDLDKSKMTIPILQDLTEEYLRQRSPYMQAIAVGHFDTEHPHIHIMSSPVELITNRNLRMSQTDFANLKTHMQNYQMEKYPELISIVRHGKKEQERTSGKAQKLENIPILERGKNKSGKSQVKEKILSCMLSSDSKENFFELLAAEGLSAYRRGNDWKGVSHNDKNYRFSTLLNDYSERFSQLDQKNERIEDLDAIREAKDDRDQEVEMDYESSNSSSRIPDVQEDPD